MSVASPLLKIGVTSEVFHDWGTVPKLNAVLESICKQGSRRCSGAGSASVGTSSYHVALDSAGGCIAATRARICQPCLRGGAHYSEAAEQAIIEMQQQLGEIYAADEEKQDPKNLVESLQQQLERAGMAHKVAAASARKGASKSRVSNSHSGVLYVRPESSLCIRP